MPESDQTTPGLLYRSNLLGWDKRITNFGGGFDINAVDVLPGVAGGSELRRRIV